MSVTVEAHDPTHQTRRSAPAKGTHVSLSLASSAGWGRGAASISTSRIFSLL